MRRVIETLVGFAVLTGVVVGITTLTPAELPRVTTVEAIRSTKVVCVPAAAGATVMVDNTTTVTPLGGATTQTNRAVLTGQETSVVAEGTALIEVIQRAAALVGHELPEDYLALSSTTPRGA